MKKLAFEQFCQFVSQFNIPESSYKELFDKLEHIETRQDLEMFSWAVPYVESLNKGVENSLEYDNRFLEIMFNDWMNDDLDAVLNAFFKFIGISPKKSVYDNLVMYLEKYRSQQPKFVTWKSYE